MSVGVLVLTHTGLGQALVAAAKAVVGPLPLRTEVVEYRNGDDVEAYARRAARALMDLDAGDGVLVLTDLYGATPSNAAAHLARHGVPMRRVSGLNLPMLLRVQNYADHGLDELVATAAQGARNGVVIDSL